MFEVLDELDGQGLADALDANARADLGRRAYELMMVAGWADVHNEDSVATDGCGRVLSGMEHARANGADGTPLVAEFATAELAVLLGRSPYYADNLLRDALDIRHRHPRLWERVEQTAKLAAMPLPRLTNQPLSARLAELGDELVSVLGLEDVVPVQVWQARAVAQACHTAGLALEQARFVDTVTTRVLGSLPWARFERLLGAAIIEADPDAAKARADADAKRQGVGLGQSTEQGLITLIIKAQAGDMITAKAMIDRLAAILALEGDSEPIGHRQAKAAAILMGDPYRAVALLLEYATDTSGNDDTDGTDETDPAGQTRTGPDGERADLDRERQVDHREVVLSPDCWPAPPPRTPPGDDFSPRDDLPPGWPSDSGGPDGPDDADPNRGPVDDQTHPAPPRPDGGDPWSGLPPPPRAGDVPLPTEPPAHRLSSWDLHPCADDSDDPCPACAGTGRAPTPAGRRGLPPDAAVARALIEAVRAGKLDAGKLVPKAHLYIHLSAHALWHALHPADACPQCAAGEPVPTAARVEGRIGPALPEQLQTWLGHRRVDLKPVIDLNTNHAVDCYEVPAWMAEALHLARPGSAFPHSPSTGRRKDSDHTKPYARNADGTAAGPRQTRINNLGGLERRLHRVKTHGKGWRVYQPQRGVYVWRSPHGHWYRVDNTGTHRLGKTPDLSEHGIDPHAA